MTELYAQFMVEAGEHLERIAMRLVALGGESPPYDVSEAGRSAHSLKGAARMIGASAAGALLERLEGILAALAKAGAPSPDRIDEAMALTDRVLEAIERGDDAGDAAETVSPGDQVEAELAAVRAVLPTLPPAILESLTEFQQADILRLRVEGNRFWLVHVDTTGEMFALVADAAASHLKNAGQVIGQTVGVSALPGYEYVSTFLFASKDAPATPDDAAFPLRAEELATGDPPVLQSGSPPPPADGAPANDAPDAVESGGTEFGDAQLREIFLASADNLVQELTDTIAEAERQPESTEVLDALFRAGHSLKGAGASFGFPIVSRLGREMEAVLDQVRRRKLALSDDLIGVLYDCVDALAGIVAAAQERTLDQNAPLSVIGRLHAIARGETPPEAEPLRPRAFSASPAGGASGQIIHLSVDAADRLLDLGRDAWLAAETAAFAAPIDGPVRDAVDRTRASILAVVDSILAARMQPIGQILKAYPRMVRAVCREQNKRIRLDVVGADVRMDRLMLEAINDPLVHLVRNALDHGIEPSDERERAGKPPEGTLTVRASADRDTVAIEVRDDGRGVDCDRLRRKAVERGMLTEEAAAALTEAQALDLMFVPGLTTRDAVTELSGRGVGMDVVQANVNQLRGRIELINHPGRGLAVRLFLPLTAAVLRVVEVHVAGAPLCLPTAAVERVVRVAPGARSVEISGADGVREVISVVPATRFLPDAPREPGGGDAVVLRDHGKVIALHVDRVVDERPVLISDLGGLIPRTLWVGACTLMADGRIAPILDAGAIVAASDTNIDPAPAAESTAEPPRPTGPPHILSVDDSPTMRQLLRNVLELVGYRVTAAATGREALDALRDAQPDLVLADINMPGMDGLTLVREIRRRWPNLPVAIVSGRDREGDRKAGLDAGASAYIIKGATDRRGLLSTIARLIGEGGGR